MAARPKRRGVIFEQVVARVQSLFDPNVKVTHDERLMDRLGHKRQFDVVMRGTMAGIDVLGVIECKDIKEPVGTPHVNAFADKSANLRANIRIIASRRGFTRTALELARHHGIGTISLVQQAADDAGTAVAVAAYATIYEWSRCRIGFPNVDLRHINMSAAESILWHDEPLIELATRVLHEHFADMQESGMFQVQITFTEPARFVQHEREFFASVMVIDAERTVQKLVKHLNWYGEALYDWQAGSVRYPPNTQWTTAWFRTDFSEWQEHIGDIPPPQEDSPFELRIVGWRTTKPFSDRGRKLEEFATINIVRVEASNAC